MSINLIYCQAYFIRRFGIKSSPLTSDVKSSGDFLDTIDREFGFMQLDSLTGRK